MKDVLGTLLMIGAFVTFCTTLFMIGMDVGEDSSEANLVEMCKTHEAMVMKKDFVELKITCEVVK